MTIKVLQDLITKYSDQYYNDGESEVSDAVFDILKRRLASLEANLKDGSRVSDRVGAAPRGEIATRPVPMLSLDNVFSEDELSKWLDDLPAGTQVAIEHKLDGMSLELMYQKSVLSMATTRGDGINGEVITEHAKHILGVPESLPVARGSKSPMLIRGEVVIPYSEFLAANMIREAAGEKTYANPRNMVAGMLRRNSTDQLSENGLRFVCYEMLISVDGKWISSSSLDFPSSFEKLTPEFIGPHDHNRADLLNVMKRCERVRDTYPYEIDGLVIKCTESSMRVKLGSSNTSPNWAIAYKFPAKEGISTLRAVDWQIGRTGVLTPVARIDPVAVCGVMVSNVSLYNPDEIVRLGLMKNSTIVVARMGDVIPKIIARLPLSVGLDSNHPDSEESALGIPTHCPSCRHSVVRKGVQLVCNNHSGCTEQLVQGLVHFASRVGMDIKGLGESLARDMIREGVTKPADLYSIADPLQEDEGGTNAPWFKLRARWGEKTFDKLRVQIVKSIKSPFFKALRSIGIEDVGSITAEIIANRYQSFKDLSKATVEELAAMPYLGEITAQSIVNELSANPEVYLALDSIFDYQRINKIVQDLEGETIVVTGSMFAHAPRTEFEANLKARGARVTGTVSKNTNIVYVGTNPGKAKITKAEALEIPIIYIGVE